MEHQNKKKGEIEWSTSQVCKLSSLKTPLRKLLHDRCNLHANVSALREELHGIQHQIDVHPEDLLARKAEVDLLQKFQLASLDEELFLKQKSKINWLKVGDANTRFFHNVHDDEDDIFGSKKANIKVEETAPGVATGMILSLRESLQSCKDALETCQSELEDAKLENQKWHSAFQKESFISTGSSVSVEPRVVVNYLQNLKSSEESLREQLDKAKKKEAAFIVTIAKREQEIADLKAAVRDLRSQLKPLSMQARRLLLDPAIHEEFMRLKNLVEEKDKKVKELQDNVAAVNFTPQSKMGKMLMAKCKTLQDENEEIGNQAKEGKIHELYTKLALQKAQNIELRSECEGLCKHMEELTNNVEISNETVLILEEKLSDKEAEIKRLRQQLQQYDTVEEKTETFAAANNNDIDEDVTVSMDLEPEPEPETEEL